MMIKKILLITYLILILLPVTVYSQGGLDFLTLQSDARGQSIQSADIVDISDINALNYNPSLLNNIKKGSISLSHLKWMAGFLQENVGFGMKMPFGYVGLSVSYLYNASILKTDIYGNDLGEMDMYGLMLKAGWARHFVLIGYKFSVGVGLQYAGSVLDEYSGNSLLLDTGINYIPEKFKEKLKLGFVIKNIGTPVEYDSEGTYFPLTLQLGLSYNILALNNHKLNSYGNVSFEIGGQITIPFGIEYYLYKIIAVRVSYLLTADNVQNFSGGIGFNYKHYFIDFAAIPWAGSDLTYSATVGYNW